MNTIKVSGTGDPETRIASLEQAVNYGEVILPFPVVGEQEGGGGTGGPPSGPAGGVLSGTYPNPGLADNVVTSAKIVDGTIQASDLAAGVIPVVAYRHVQASAATTWSITHGLAFRPNVSAVDSTGREVWPGAVDYPSATTVQLTFSAAVAGEAYLS
jgi:hypothetical protein